MKFLKALFNSSHAEDNHSEMLPMELPGVVNIEPLWTHITENQAIVTEAIAPQSLGRVKFQGTRWRAWSDRPLVLEAGTVVQVIGRQRSNILVVEPSEVLAQLIRR